MYTSSICILNVYLFDVFYIHNRISIYLYMYIYIYIHTYMHLHIHICIHVYIFVRDCKRLIKDLLSA
jgi:hypothetical protein